MHWARTKSERLNWLKSAANLLGAAALITCLNQAGATETNSYIFGVTPHSDARSTYDRWRPLLNQLEKRTGYRFQLAIGDNKSTFNKELKEGHFDFVYLNPYRALVANQDLGYRPIVRDVGEKLQGILVVRKDNPIQDLHELQGKTIAFPSRNALGASLLHLANFAGAKIEVQPRYVGTHDSVYLNVALNQAAAGGGIQESLNEQPPQVRDNLRVIYRTAEFPSHPLMAHPRLPAAVREAVQSAFLELGTTPEGRALLARISIKEIGRTSISEYEPLAKLGLERFYVAE
jgi:phosphonate transport system substrate-binding protein